MNQQPATSGQKVRRLEGKKIGIRENNPKT
jgi:hypothetical protein